MPDPAHAVERSQYAPELGGFDAVGIATDDGVDIRGHTEFDEVT
jgi:hypothetical protein